MAKTVGYAVVGLGVGKSHVRGAVMAEGCELVALCDLEQARLDEVKLACPETTKTYTSFTQMLKNTDIDVVSIAVPSGLHAKLAVQALKAGKHVLIEKPMDITVPRILKIEEARIATGLKVGGIFQNRKNPVMAPFKEAVDAGRLGRIFTGFFRVSWFRGAQYFEANGGWRGTWALDGGGSLMNQGVHTVDIMQWLLGDVHSVKSHMDVISHDIETEDFTLSTITFKSGAIATLTSTTSAAPGFGTNIEVTGTLGSIYVDGGRLVQWNIAGPDAKEEQAEMMAMYGPGGSGPKNDGASDPNAIMATGHNFQIQDMVDAVRFDRDPMVGPMEATKAVRIINAVYESARKGGKEIVFKD